MDNATSIQIGCRGRAKVLPYIFFSLLAGYQCFTIVFADETRGVSAPSAVPKAKVSDATLASEKLELGEMLVFNGNPRAALRVLKEAVALDPDLYQAHFDLASLYQQMGKLPESIHEYRQITRLHNKDKDAYFTLGMLLKEHGDLDEAITNFKEALSLSKGPETNIESTLAFTLLSSEKAAEALTEFDRLLASGEKTAEPEWILGKAMALFKLQKVAQALTEIDRAMALRPNYPAAHNLKGDILYADGRRDVAIQEYTEATKEDPGFYDAYLSLGNLYLKDKQFTQAKDIFLKAEQIKRDDKNILYGLAYALENCGDVKGAIEKYQSVLGLENNPNQRSNVAAHLSELTGH